MVRSGRPWHGLHVEPPLRSENLSLQPMRSIPKLTRLSYEYIEYNSSIFDYSTVYEGMESYRIATELIL